MVYSVMGYVTMNENNTKSILQDVSLSKEICAPGEKTILDQVREKVNYTSFLFERVRTYICPFTLKKSNNETKLSWWMWLDEVVRNQCSSLLIVII